MATFKDRIASSEVDRRVDEFHARINAMYGDLDENICVYPKEDGQKIFPHLCSVVFVTRQMQRSDVAELRNVVYFSAIKMIKIVRPPEFIVGQLVKFLLLLYICIAHSTTVKLLQLASSLLIKEDQKLLKVKLDLLSPASP